MFHDPIVLIAIGAFLVAGFVLSATPAPATGAPRRTSGWQRWSFSITVSIVVNLYLGVSMLEALYRPLPAPPRLVGMTIVELPPAQPAPTEASLMEAEEPWRVPELPAFTYAITLPPLDPLPATPREVTLLDPGAWGRTGEGGNPFPRAVSPPGGSPPAGGGGVPIARGDIADDWVSGDGPRIARALADAARPGKAGPRRPGTGQASWHAGPATANSTVPGGPGAGDELPRPGGAGYGNGLGGFWGGYGMGMGPGAGGRWDDGNGLFQMPGFASTPPGVGEMPTIAVGALPPPPRLTAPRLTPSARQIALPPRVLTYTRPEYPREAYDEGEEGLVVVRVSVNRDGSVRAITPVVAPRDRRLTQSVLAAVARWTYAPATVDGMPVESETPVLIQVEFRRGGITLAY